MRKAISNTVGKEDLNVNKADRKRAKEKRGKVKVKLAVELDPR